MSDTITTKWGTGGRMRTVSVLRTIAAAGDYAAEDVLSDSATNGAGTAITFSKIAKTKGGAGYITQASILCSTTALTPRLALLLFKNVPTCELDDNAANSAVLAADQANFIGQIDFPAMSALGTGMSGTIATTSTSGNLPIAFVCDNDDDSLYGVLVTRDAITGESANMTVRINLTAECD